MKRLRYLGRRLFRITRSWIDQESQDAADDAIRSTWKCYTRKTP